MYAFTYLDGLLTVDLTSPRLGLYNICAADAESTALIASIEFFGESCQFLGDLSPCMSDECAEDPTSTDCVLQIAEYCSHSESEACELLLRDLDAHALGEQRAVRVAALRGEEARGEG